MAVDGVLTSIELCKLIKRTVEKLYEVHKDIKTYFAEQRGELIEKISDLTMIVEQVEDVLTETPMKYKKGLENVLKAIEGSCSRVKTFFDKLDKYASYKGAQFILKNLANYFNTQNQFKDFNRIIAHQNFRLRNFLSAGTFEVAGEIIVDIRRESENERRDFEALFNLVQKVDEKVETTLRQRDSFEKERFALDKDLLVKPDEISNESYLGCYFDEARLGREKVMLYRVHDFDGEKMNKRFSREKRNLLLFSSGSILRVIGYCDEPDEKFLVLEYMERGLLTHVLHDSGKTLSLETKLRLAKTASSSLYRLHEKLIHTCLTSFMFHVDEHYTAKLSGLQFARTFESVIRYVWDYDVDSHLPLPLRPPKPTKAADIYGFGVVLWEIFTQTKPFSTLEKEIGREPTSREVEKFLLVDKREEYLVGDQTNPVMAEVSEIIRKCRAIDHLQRPDAGEIFDTLERMYDDMKYEEFQKDQ